MTLLLTILQPLAPMVLQQPVLPAEMPRTKPAVPDDALRRVPALLERAAYLLGRHAAAQGQRHVQGGAGRQGERGQRRRGRGEVLAGVDEAQVGGGEVVAEGEEGGEGLYGG